MVNRDRGTEVEVRKETDEDMYWERKQINIRYR